MEDEQTERYTVTDTGYGASGVSTIKGPGIEQGLVLDHGDNIPVSSILEALNRAYLAGGVDVIGKVWRVFRQAVPGQAEWLEPCGCLRNGAGAHRVGCPVFPEGVRGD